VGALGYLECAVELAGQAARGAPAFDTVVIAAYSGGSLAGLHMGKQLGGLPGEVVGVPIAFAADTVREHVRRMVGGAARRFGLAVEAPKTVHLLDGYQGAGRASVGEAALAGIAGVAREEGLVLDPVYTGKAFLGLLDTLERDRRALGQRVCFIHTGGVFSLYPHREALSRLIDAALPPGPRSRG
jgi:D-cysteine desulfhydrase